jgi:hypothetical protein
MSLHPFKPTLLVADHLLTESKQEAQPQQPVAEETTLTTPLLSLLPEPVKEKKKKKTDLVLVHYQKLIEIVPLPLVIKESKRDLSLLQTLDMALLQVPWRVELQQQHPKKKKTDGHSLEVRKKQEQQQNHLASIVLDPKSSILTPQRSRQRSRDVGMRIDLIDAALSLLEPDPDTDSITPEAAATTEQIGKRVAYFFSIQPPGVDKHKLKQLIQSFTARGVDVYTIVFAVTASMLKRLDV